MHLFYTPDIVSDHYELNDEESRHCIKVLRRRKGDIISLTDGKGNLYAAELVNDNPKKCKLNIIEINGHFGQRNFNIHLAVAPTKNINRFEWFLEKATEIGIDEITPVICENSERKTLNQNRMKKILVAALKQSLKAYLPKLNEPLHFNDLIKKQSQIKKYIAYIDDDVTLTLKKDYQKGEDVLLLIGPEGDFSPYELNLAKQNNYYPISLGKSRLRTETAAVVACSTIHLLNE